MGKTLLETLIGAAVLTVAVVFVVFAYTRSGVGTVTGYEVTARFSSVDGLSVGDDVRISGIKVGTVLAQTLEPTFFQAVLSMSIDSSIELSEDTTAAIVSVGLLGGKYVALEPGGAEEILQPGDEITLTQSSINLEGLLGKVIYSVGSSGGGDKE